MARIVLTLFGFLALLAGGADLIRAQNAMQQIVGAVELLIAACLISAGAILEVLSPMRKKVDGLDMITTTLQTLQKTVGDIAEGSQLPTGEKRAANLPPLPGEESYYVAVDGKPTGPHKRQAIESFLTRQTVTPDMLILREGDREWRRLGDVFEITKKS